MSRKIGIIGMGNVGAAAAHYIVAGGYADDLVLIDKNEAKVTSDAVDFEEAMPNLPFHTNITINDYDSLKDADVIISAIGDISLQLVSNGDRFIELPGNVEKVKDVGQKIKASGFNGVLVVITNPVDVITGLFQEVTGLPKNQVIGTGTLLDSARMKRAVAKNLNIDSRCVSGYNLGEHGNSQFAAWSTVKALGQPITELAKEKNLDLDKIDQEARVGGYTVFSGKHYTNYGVSTAGVRAALAILSNANEELCVSNYREEYGVYLSYPVIIGRNGVVTSTKLDLTKEELEKLQYSADFIKQKTKEAIG